MRNIDDNNLDQSAFYMVDHDDSELDGDDELCNNPCVCACGSERLCDDGLKYAKYTQ